MKDSTKIIGIIAASIAGCLGAVRGCNMAWNNRKVSKSGYNTKSFATGLYGHIEHTKYSDGSQDVKIYPGFAHRLFDSELHQDLDGDNKIDRIRRNGSELKMNRLSELLVREHDYPKHKDRFDEADKQLQGLIDGE